MSFNLKKISIQESNQFSKLMIDYVSNSAEIKPFINQHFSTIKMDSLVDNLKFDNNQRLMLFDELLNQYVGFEVSGSTKENIISIKNNNTFTVTTGHQLCLFTGPIYFIYKILTVIVQCEELNKKHPNYHFVPVFWMAGEDHDKEEINHAHVFGKKITWETTQHGKVGKFNLEGIHEIIHQLNEILGQSITTDSIIQLIEKTYSFSNLNDATRYLVNALFGQYGLIIIDPDHAPFKKVFSDEIKKEIRTSFVEKNVLETNASLINKGYKAQVNPRTINLFYAKGSVRERLVFSENKYQVLNTDLSFSENEINFLIDNNCEVFSPNVLMRPLYQQKLLPNLFYVGGPGEIAYWLQLKASFDDAAIFFPVLQPRKFALLFNEKHVLKWNSLGLNTEDVFLSSDEIDKKIVAAEFMGYDEEKNNIDQLFNALKQKVTEIDQSLAGTVDAEKQKTLKSLEHLEQKIKKSLKQKNEITIQQIKKIKNAYFPEQTIQERKDNFLNFYSKNLFFIDQLKRTFETTTSSECDYLILTIY
jgi:bacillithiol biosynthesis cysteine-adding enzyme BshC